MQVMYRLFEFIDNRKIVHHATFTCDVHHAVCALDERAEITSIEWCHRRCTETEIARLTKLGIPSVSFPVEHVDDVACFHINRR